MAIGIASSMSPGYLQVNPSYGEGASSLSDRLSGDETLGEKVDRIKKTEIENALREIARNERELKEKRDLLVKKEREQDRLELEQRKKEDEKKLYNRRDLEKDVLNSKDPLNDITDEEKAIVDQMKKRELEVIAHEAAHASVGGRFAGSPKYSRTVGPDGRSYITGGEVAISVPASSDPEETARNMRQVQAAALAPGSPSAQDVSVAAQAAAAAAHAQAQMASGRASSDAEYGTQPQPGREAYGATDRVQGSLPIVKKYESSVDSVENDIGREGLVSSINRTREQVESNAEGSAFIDWSGTAGPDGGSSSGSSGVAPEDNLYNTRQAKKIYFMNGSPNGLWTVDNGFEKTESSPELEQAQFLNLAA